MYLSVSLWVWVCELISLSSMRSVYNVCKYLTWVWVWTNLSIRYEICLHNVWQYVGVRVWTYISVRHEIFLYYVHTSHDTCLSAGVSMNSSLYPAWDLSIMYVSISWWEWVWTNLSIRHEICAPVPSSLSQANTNGTAPITLEVLVIFEATNNPWPMLRVAGGYLNKNKLEGRQVGSLLTSCSTSKHLSTTFSLGLLVVHGLSVCRGHCSPGVLTPVHKQVQWSRQLNIFRWISPVAVSVRIDRQTNCWYEINAAKEPSVINITDKDNLLSN